MFSSKLLKSLFVTIPVFGLGSTMSCCTTCDNRHILPISSEEELNDYTNKKIEKILTKSYTANTSNDNEYINTILEQAFKKRQAGVPYSACEGFIKKKLNKCSMNPSPSITMDVLGHFRTDVMNNERSPYFNTFLVQDQKSNTSVHCMFNLLNEYGRKYDNGTPYEACIQKIRKKAGKCQSDLFPSQLMEIEGLFRSKFISR